MLENLTFSRVDLSFFSFPLGSIALILFSILIIFCGCKRMSLWDFLCGLRRSNKVTEDNNHTEMEIFNNRASQLRRDHIHEKNNIKQLSTSQTSSRTSSGKGSRQLPQPLNSPNRTDILKNSDRKVTMVGPVKAVQTFNQRSKGNTLSVVDKIEDSGSRKDQLGNNNVSFRNTMSWKNFPNDENTISISTKKFGIHSPQGELFPHGADSQGWKQSPIHNLGEYQVGQHGSQRSGIHWKNPTNNCLEVSTIPEKQNRSTVFPARKKPLGTSSQTIYQENVKTPVQKPADKPFDRLGADTSSSLISRESISKFSDPELRQMTEDKIRHAHGWDSPSQITTVHTNSENSNFKRDTTGGKSEEEKKLQQTKSDSKILELHEITQSLSKIFLAPTHSADENDNEQKTFDGMKGKTGKRKTSPEQLPNVNSPEKVKNDIHKITSSSRPSKKRKAPDVPNNHLSMIKEQRSGELNANQVQDSRHNNLSLAKPETKASSDVNRRWSENDTSPESLMKNNSKEKETIESRDENYDNRSPKKRKAPDVPINEVPQFKSSMRRENRDQSAIQPEQNQNRSNDNSSQSKSHLEMLKSSHLHQTTVHNTLKTQDKKMFQLKAKYICERKKGLEVYRPPLTENLFGRIPIGRPNHLFKEKVLLLVGGTGSGKTTWINGLFNYIHGMEWTDEYRVKLIEEMTPGGKHNQAFSQTKEVMPYTIYRSPWFKVPFSITVIDTPGFGDTQGIHRDKEIVQQITTFLKTRARGRITHIDAIGFVIQSSLARLTPTQRYVFNSITSLFGKDVADNIFLLLTFADRQKPQVLSGIKEADLPYKSHFKFNNSALFVSSNEVTDEMDQDEGHDRRVDRMFWNMGTKSYKKFMKTLETVQPKSLVLTEEVLKERQFLEMMMEAIQQNIKMSLTKLEEMKTEEEILRKYDDYIDRNRDFNYHIFEHEVHKIKLGDAEFATNCSICKKTCHTKCNIPTEKKFKCSAMKEGHCQFCPYNCHWKNHKSEPFVYELRVVKVTKTAEELKRRYEDATGRKLTAEQMIEKCKVDLDDLETEAVLLAEEARISLERLGEIALKPNPLSTTDYIDLMIQEEEFLTGPGWRESIRQLEHVKEHAKIMQMLQKKQRDFSDVKRLKSSRRGQDGLTITDRIFLNLKRSTQEPV